MIWAKTKIATGRNASTSTSHGGFDDDAPTMNSVARRILDVPDGKSIADFSEEVGEGRHLTIWEAPTAWSQSSAGNGYGNIPPLRSAANPTMGVSSFPTTAATRRGGRQRALCVGINRYRSAPLSGCVADARTWAQTLTQLGFDSPLLLLDEQATRSAMLDSLKNLVTTSVPGDVVVFQYAGHGTTLPDINGDEVGGDSPGDDEALCPYDYDTGAFIIDDDVAEIFRSIPAGVNVTCFVDCCHSGTISRFAVGTAPQARGADQDQRPRFLEATEDMKQAHLQFRNRIGRSRAIGARGPESMREVVFSACLSREVAWESGGHGDFTQYATRLLRAGINGISHEEFQRRVMAAFGPMPRQHPELDCAPTTRAGALLQPLTGRVSAEDITEASSSTVVNETLPARIAALAQELKLIAQKLQR